LYVRETRVQVRGGAGGDGAIDVAAPSSRVEEEANWAEKNVK